MRVYFDGLNVFQHSIDNPLKDPPNTKWRYRNSDPLTLGKIVRDKVEARGTTISRFHSARCSIASAFGAPSSRPTHGETSS